MGIFAPNIHDSLSFLSRLPHHEEFYFRYGSLKAGEGMKKGKLIYLNGLPPEEKISKFVPLNNEGNHILVVINAGGQKASEIERVRAVFVDLDGSPLEPILKWTLDPHFVIETSPKRYHVYWIVEDGFPLEFFTPVQKALAKRFGGDDAVCDLPRLMRLPGFVHHGKEGNSPFVSRIIHELSNSEGQSYSLEQICEALGTTRDLLLSGIGEETIQTERFGVSETIGDGERNKTIFKLASSRIAKGLEKEEVIASCLAINKARCKPPLKDVEVQTCVESAWRMHLSKLENQPIPPNESQATEEDEKLDAGKKQQADRGKSKKKANYGDYVTLVEKYLGKIHRDIFSDEPVFKDVEGIVNPDEKGEYQKILDKYPRRLLESICSDAEGFSASKLECHILRAAAFMKPEFLVSVPKWDGKDRIREIFQCVDFPTKKCFINRQQAETLLKTWGATAWRRIYNPKIKNRIFILHGPQGIGKDVLLNTLTQGVGKYWVSPSIGTRNENDLWQSIKDGMFIHIEEVDRIAKLDPALVKAFLDAEKKTLRIPYLQNPGTYRIRSSFTGSCNRDHFLCDYTGLRRFIVIDIAGIRWDYGNSEEDRRQILAQYKALADSGWPNSEDDKARVKDSETALRAYHRYKTPDDPRVEMVQEFQTFLLGKQPSIDKKEFQSSELENIWQKLSKDYNHGVNGIKKIMREEGFQIKNKKGTFWRAIGIEEGGEEEEIEEGIHI